MALNELVQQLLNFNYQLSGLNGDGAGASAAGAAGAATFGAAFLEDFFADFFFAVFFLRAATYPPYGVELLPIFSHYIHQNIQSVPTFL